MPGRSSHHHPGVSLSGRAFRARVAGVALAPALALTGAGCTSSADPTAADTPAAAAASVSPSDGEREVTVLQPGRPGEPAATVDPTAAASGSDWNHADVAFMQMMVPHHAQALEMSQLAADRAESEQVKAMARRIRGAQGPEIIAMAAWLDERGLEVPRHGEDADTYDHSEHGRTGMPGMLSDEELARLASADGVRFDRLFLRFMIRHHEGALEMASDVAAAGTDVRVSEVAGDVATGQAAEIRLMRELLSEL